jgi:predicted N-acetyltransferase YhbS
VLAVRPALGETALDEADRQREPLVLVPGTPRYYPRSAFACLEA